MEKSMMPGLSRRKFMLTGTTALSGAMAFGASGLQALELTQPPANDPIRIGLIGTGSRGSGIAQVMKDIPSLSLTACCDVLPDRLQNGMRLAAKGAKAYTDYRKLLEDKDLDAVIIATPLYLHYEIGKDAIDAGKHIYMEKTMTYDIPQALDMVRRVHDSNLVFQVGHQYRYYALYHKIFEVIQQGWCGEVMHYECQYHRNNNWRKTVADPALEQQINWRMYREYSGGLMAELCAHQIDIVNWMTGAHPVKVSGLGGIDYWKDGRETFDNVRTVFEYPNGVKANVSSVLSNAFKGYSIRVLGTKATIEIQRDKAFLYPEATQQETGVVDGVSGATLKAWTQGEPSPIEFEEPGDQSLDPTAYALLDFGKCIRENKQPFSNVGTGRDVALAVHMGNTAMREEKYQYWKPEYSL